MKPSHFSLVHFSRLMASQQLSQKTCIIQKLYVSAAPDSGDMETGLFRVAEVLWLKLFFFDIDGTILSHRIKDVPISTRQALCQLSDIHVDRVIATGRHSTEIDRLPVNDIKFDAYITLNGQLCYDLKGNVFYENPIKETGEILKFFHSSTDDIEMLRYVQEGIAMGNADDFVKSVADYVTADIDDNGIEKGLRYLGLL